MTNRRAIVADAMLVTAVLIWAISFPIAKAVMTEWGNHKYFFLAGRFWLAFALFLIPFLMKVPIFQRRFALRDLAINFKPGFWVGLTMVVTYSFQFEALRIGSAGEVAFITAFSSVLVPVGLLLFFKRRVRISTLAGILIATIGVILMTVTEKLSLSSAGVLALVGAVGFAADMILIDYFLNLTMGDGETKKYETVPFLTAQFLTLAIGTSLLSVIWELPAQGLPSKSNTALGGMVFMAVVATAFAFWIQARYQPDTTPDHAALVFTLEPALAAAFGYILLSEIFTLPMAGGAVLILIGVASAEFSAARRDMQSPSDTEGPSDADGPPTGGSLEWAFSMFSSTTFPEK